MNYSLISLSWTVPNYSWKLSACCQEMSHWPLCVLVGGKESCSREKIKLCFHRKQEMNLSVVSYDSFKAQYCQRNTVCMDVWQSTDPAVRDPKYFLMESKHAEVCSKGERLSLSSKVLNNYTFCYSRKKKSSVISSCSLNKSPWRETSKQKFAPTQVTMGKSTNNCLPICFSEK